MKQAGARLNHAQITAGRVVVPRPLKMDKMLVMVLASLLFAAPLLAQRDMGSISGRVIDPTGEVVPGASVQLTEEQTGISRLARTNAEGFYIFPVVPFGSYRLEVEAAGFKKFLQPGIALAINQNLTVSVKLQLGKTTQEVTVTSPPPQVNVVSGAVKDVVGPMRMTELPLNGRNVLDLQELVNGSVSAGSGDQFGNTPTYAFNGGMGWTNNYTLDGGEYAYSFYNSPITFPDPDAIQEFSVLTSSYSAEYGRNRGAVINAIIKSGTDEFHGDAYDFIRNTDFDSRDFFATNQVNLATGKQIPGTAVSPFIRNQFGGTIGGPIKKDKTFFFAGWEQLRKRGSPNLSTFRTPSEAMRNGDYSELSKQLTNPSTGTPFRGNIIPSTDFSTPAVAFNEKYVPLPNNPGNVFSAPSPSNENSYQLITRIDEELSSRDHLAGHYVLDNDSILAPYGDFVNWFEDSGFHRQSVNLNYTHTFSPTLLNTFTGTYDRVIQRGEPIPPFNWQTLGANVPLTFPNQVGWMDLGLSGYYGASNGLPWLVAANTFGYSNATTWVKGKNTFTWGAQISRYQTYQRFEFWSDGLMEFTGQFTGDSSADFLLGDIAVMLQDSPGTDNLRQTLWGFYGEDSLKLTPRLTLTLGLRYDPFFGFSELDGEAIAVRPGEQSKVYPTAPLGLVFPGDPNVNPHFWAPDWKNFAPRFGFAWDVFGDQKTALRGGYGIFYDSPQGIAMNLFPTDQPFSLDEEVIDRPLANPYLGASPFPFSPPTTPAQRANFKFVVPASPTSSDLNNVTPYTQQWNLTIERELPDRFVVSGGYVGSRSEHLLYQLVTNPAIYGPGATLENVQQRRVLPQFSNVTDMTTTGYSDYNSFQLLVKRPMFRGFTLNAAYTLSKNLGVGYMQSSANLGGDIRDPFDVNLNYGLTNDDVTHVLSSSFIWDLPSLSQRSILFRNIFGGWEASGILEARTGFPFTVLSGVNNSLNGIGNDTADLVPGQAPSLTSGSKAQRIKEWFNTAAFTENAIGTYGNVGVNTMRGPGMWNLDMGIFKNFRLSERFKLQYRAEFFNILNHANLGTPVSTVSSADFGQILSSSTPRVIEMALKLFF